MSTFEHVTIVKKANIYAHGKVSSRTVLFPDGSRKTLGVMLPGDYAFDTDSKEIMEILSGDLDVQLPGSTLWKGVHAGETFEVPAKSKFSLKVRSVTDYCCSYV